jgi:exodeoxyribonuclease V alpha subunit
MASPAERSQQNGSSSGQPGAGEPTEVLAGSIERVTFRNPANGFCVLRIKARGHRDLVTVSGVWVNSREHGQQFKAAFLRSSPPTTAEGIEKYLGSEPTDFSTWLLSRLDNEVVVRITDLSVSSWDYSTRMPKQA